jgi:4-amino-4-deoxy-L-arabinose transferase-like glycosyltransferase
VRDSRKLPALFSRPEIVLLPVALVIRLLGIVSRPIWYDEAFAVLFSSEGPARMVYGTLAPDALGSAADIHPLGYYSLLWAWMAAFGRSILAGRAFSVLIGCAAFWLAILLLRKLAGERAAWWGGVFLALSPFHTHYSQEVRMYSLLACFLIAGTFFFLRALGLLGGGRSRWVDWALFSVFAALAMYTHNLAVFYLAPLALIPFWLPAVRRRLRSAKRVRGRGRLPGPAPEISAVDELAENRLRIRNTILSTAAAVLLYLPWLIRLPGQLAKVSAGYWTEAPGSDRLITTLLSYTTNLPVSQGLLPFALLSSVLTLALATWQTFRAVLSRRRPETLTAGLVLVYLAFVPVALLFVISQILPVFLERALLASGIVYLLWVAWALAETELPRFVRIILATALVVGMFIGLQTHLTYTGFPYAPYAEVNVAIRDSLQGGPPSGDVRIIHSNKLSALPAFLLDPDLPHRYLPDLPGSGSDTLALPTQEVIGFFASEDIETAVGEAERVWFVVFRQEVEEYQAAGEEEHPQLAWLDEHFTLAGSETWEDLIVYEYILP